MRPVAKLIAVGCLLASGAAAPGQGLAQRSAAAGPPLPEAIYWPQDVFLIPYQWSASGDQATADEVILYLSEDRGTNWKEVERARPDVRSFLYRAARDGEYWFAVRTLDQSGRLWPAGGYAPELRVIVDTQIPAIAQPVGGLNAAGQLEVSCDVQDANVDPSKLRFEARAGGANDWVALPVTNLMKLSAGGIRASSVWRPPATGGPIQLRASVQDLAGNPAGAGAIIDARRQQPGAARPGIAASTVGASRDPFLAAAPISFPTANAEPWRPAPRGERAVATTGRPPIGGDTWQADATARSPFRASDAAAWSSSTRQAAAAPYPSTAEVAPQPRRAPNPSRYHRASTSRPALDRPLDSLATRGGLSPVGRSDAEPPAPADVLMVNDPQFALDYELQSVGNWGVSRVEAWGTDDGGQTWRMYSLDSDNRSPVNIDTPGPGRYGFRIVVEGVGSLPVERPRPGDQPEIQVEVDTQPPRAQLTSVAQGNGHLGGHLIIQWRAEDDHLGPRPVTLSYGGRPSGPWIPIAANLENREYGGGGRYAWRLHRHLPTAVYVRLEVADRAGNVARDQTSDPVPLDFAQPAGRIRGARPLGE